MFTLAAMRPAQAWAPRSSRGVTEESGRGDSSAFSRRERSETRRGAVHWGRAERDLGGPTERPPSSSAALWVSM
jgi:hypothetical protein